MKSIFTFLFIFFSLSMSYAQLQKGAYQISGETWVEKVSYPTKDNALFVYSELSSPPFQSVIKRPIALWRVYSVPSLQYFVNDRLSFGASVGFERINHIVETNKEEFKRGRFFISPTLTYFFNPKSNWKFYSNLSYVLTRNWLSNANEPDRNYAHFLNGFGLNIGTTRFLNPNIALNLRGYLNVNFIRENKKLDDFEGNYGFKIDFQNFIQSPFFYKAEENLLSKNRMVIGASFFTHIENEALILDTDYGYFPLKNLLVGINSSSNLYFGTLRNINHRSDIKPYIQYYVPITKKTAILANVSMPISIISYQEKKTVIVPAIGINHFLSKYVAVEALVKYTPERESHIYEEGQGFSFETNIRYFLK